MMIEEQAAMSNEEIERARVIRDALERYAQITVGADKALAEMLAAQSEDLARASW